MADTKIPTIEDLQREIASLKDQLEEAQDKQGAFYFLLECENCDEEIYEGINVTALEHRNLPAIPFDMASQTKFECPKCGADNYTGDFRDLVFCDDADDEADELDEDD